MIEFLDLAEALPGRELLIFDFDGTIADTSTLHAAAFEAILAPIGIALDYSEIAGLKTLDAIRHCAQLGGRSMPEPVLIELARQKQKIVRELIPASIHPLPGVDLFLRWARPRFKIALVTSGSGATIELALEALGYTGWFHPLICAEDVQNGKPDPEGFLRVLRETHITAGRALVFEDSQAGFAAAQSANIAFINVKQKNGRCFSDFAMAKATVAPCQN